MSLSSDIEKILAHLKYLEYLEYARYESILCLEIGRVKYRGEICNLKYLQYFMQ